MGGEFVPLVQAAKRLGVNRSALARLVKAGTLPVYESPLDRRKKMLAAEDIRQLMTPRRAVAAGTREGASTAA